MLDLLARVNEFLSHLPATWAVCGGFALDLYLNKNIRRHGDIDICVLEPDRVKVCEYMWGNGWDVYEFRGQGYVRPLDNTMRGEPRRNIMCVKRDCELVRFYDSDVPELKYHEFIHTGITQLNYIEFLFNECNCNSFIFDERRGITREMSKAILSNRGIPYLSPELALLYKASKPDDIRNKRDFDMVYPRMTGEQKRWFSASMDMLYPNGHVFMSP